MIFFTAFTSGIAWAKPRHYIGPGYGRKVKVLPRGHHTIVVKNIRYHYRKGVFYRPKGRYWAVVRPPVGAVVAALTATAVLVAVAGHSYYLCEGTYYKKVPAGYKVVEVETVPPPVMNTGNRVRVTAQLLNLRSGPAKSHAVIRQLAYGTVLELKGNAPDWYYVELSDGTAGWVVKKFTAAVPPGANG